MNHCGVSLLNKQSLAAMKLFIEDHASLGGRVFEKHGNPLDTFREQAAELLHTLQDNISFTVNTASGLNMIANGYPFESGDEILSFSDEYPANHYPWKLQSGRGAVLKEIRSGKTGVFSLTDIIENITSRTKIIALSHVQFTSGCTLDLPYLGEICRERGIDLVIDAAQSLGALPVYPEEWNIAAIAASGWKWLMGPIGSGLLYTSPDFRKKIRITMGGSDLMIQGQDYLNHEWNPHTDGRKFEYATMPVVNAAGLAAAIAEINKTGIETVYDMIIDRQQVFTEIISEAFSPSDPDAPAQYALHPEERQLRSGILSFFLKKADPEKVMKELASEGLTVSSRGGYLRIAPHYCNTADEVSEAAEKFIRILNK